MKNVSAIDMLNLLVRVQNRSLPRYLMDAAPFVAPKHAGGKELLQSIASDQATLVDELADEILARGGIVDRGSFPTEFTDLHDLSLDYLLKRAAVDQQKIVTGIEEAVTSLNGDRGAFELGQRVLGTAKAHLDMLEEYQADTP